MKFNKFRFGRLSEVDPVLILAQLQDPRVSRHLPLLPSNPDIFLVEQLIAKKESCWEQYGLGHWAIFSGGEYAGWGGFQKENNEWDFGLVLRAEFFASGKTIMLQALDWAHRATLIDRVTFLLPLSRSQRALTALGANKVAVVDYNGIPFQKWEYYLSVSRNL